MFVQVGFNHDSLVVHSRPQDFSMSYFKSTHFSTNTFQTLLTFILFFFYIYFYSQKTAPREIGCRKLVIANNKIKIYKRGSDVFGIKTCPSHLCK